MDSSEDGEGSVFVYGSPNIEICKGLCGTAASDCYGVEYLAAAQRCEVWTQPIEFVKPNSSYQCFMFEPDSFDSTLPQAPVLL